jgi:cystathionine beta-lyase/cystathionine gamma-synthase
MCQITRAYLTRPALDAEPRSEPNHRANCGGVLGQVDRIALEQPRVHIRSVYGHACERLNQCGAIQGPFDSFLALRGVKTLALRMERQSDSALQIAQWLAQHSKIRRVHYPGLTTHPQHELARRQMRAFGAMIAVEIDGTSDDARRFLERCRPFTLVSAASKV